jgi:vancomycin resistance protein VanJ
MRPTEQHANAAGQGVSTARANPWRTRGRAFLTVLSLLYAVVVLGACLALYLASDRWWFATLILFGPRWPWALPLFILLPAAALGHRRLLGLLTVVAVLLLVPIMGLCLPWGAVSAPSCTGPALRVLTCNVHHGDLDPDALGVLIAAEAPDVVALQSWSDRYKAAVFAFGDRHVERVDQLCLASRYPIRSGELLHDPDFEGNDSAAGRFEVEAPWGTLRFVSLHLDSPREGLLDEFRTGGMNADHLEENSARRRRQSEAVARWLEPWEGKPLLIAGDFNTPRESTVYRDYWSGYRNAFSAGGLGFGSTFFTRHTAVRIDHILAGPGWHCRRCRVGPAVGSPHHPVIADLCRDPNLD